MVEGLEENVAVKCVNLTKKFHKTVALDNISFELEKGKCLLITGPNGAGKTTLLNIISTITKPTEGKAFVFGCDSDKEFSKISGKVSCMWERPSLYPFMSAMENLRFFTAINNKKWGSYKREAEKILNYFDLYDARNKFVKNLSKGMEQKVDLSRTLLLDHELILLDEPAGSMDNKSKKRFVKKIEEHKKQGKTIIIITHHSSIYEDVADRLMILKNGRIILYENLEKIKLEWGMNERVAIVTCSNKEKAEKILKELKFVKNTYLSNTAVHVFFEKELDMYAVMKPLAENGIKIEKITMKMHNLDKYIGDMIVESK